MERKRGGGAVQQQLFGVRNLLGLAWLVPMAEERKWEAHSLSLLKRGEGKRGGERSAQPSQENCHRSATLGLLLLNPQRPPPPSLPENSRESYGTTTLAHGLRLWVLQLWTPLQLRDTARKYAKAARRIDAWPRWSGRKWASAPGVL
ncbi:hypothetical protein HJG60_008025 [Phyllostomus discolor]|uniref:Uncharacterized protein n=1 Tax=Phyllostomus discolor TaxID=89673 RepID=A0A834ERV5_9CHIR|nr:hypothetical protein HJG60_008025 [Phyllostomus discolor]